VTDDEAFIRAVVAAPGDEAPRLVYADWLDERGDPRGAYLRAELEWARERARERSAGDVIGLANALDSLWISRLSRPPIGVCPDGLGFSDRGPELTLGDIRILEDRLGHQLPSDYRAYLLNVNGGRPDRDEITARVGSSGIAWMAAPLRVETFFAAGPGGVGPDSEFHLLRLLRPEVFDRFVPIARLEGFEYLLLGVSGRAWCHVYHWSGLGNEHDPGAPEKLASSLADLFDRLQPPFVEVEASVRQGDVQRLVRWLETGGKVGATHAGTRDDLLSIAIRHKQADLVSELFRRGAGLTSDAMNLADSSGDPEIIRLVQDRLRQLPESLRWYLGLGARLTARAALVESKTM
jgi:uncharacterized protein (TIGR02996 family)